MDRVGQLAPWHESAGFETGDQQILLHHVVMAM